MLVDILDREHARILDVLLPDQADAVWGNVASLIGQDLRGNQFEHSHDASRYVAGIPFAVAFGKR